MKPKELKKLADSEQLHKLLEELIASISNLNFLIRELDDIKNEYYNILEHHKKKRSIWKQLKNYWKDKFELRAE